MITYCAECDNCFRPAKNSPPWRWMCIKHKRLEGFGFVTKTDWDDAPPYLFCNAVNGGDCPLFEPIKTQPEET